ncbi:hypothetical protein F0L68_01730 [Solihabitans fulvus]|uniref:Uncharacterized protein n=1 Tax=Solihabitans fulvus TaxID=1892852 RepID=A0A5B2XUC2_9PSEU|nr:SCO2521 family protein [Solihabitans fulvus]KAA2266489.1 hypothetical protein F0L68_01730 [Solihabitans fulvus]
MLVVGEIRTCLLHNTGPLPRAVVTQLLGLVPGQRVLTMERPIGRAVSPELTTGIDCRLATGSTAKARGIGTVHSRAVITGGLVLQGVATARLRRAEAGNRLAWSHYAGQPGVVEVTSAADAADLAEGYLGEVTPLATLDLGSVSEHLIGGVQMRPQLDHVTSVRSRPTRVRWVARFGDSATPRAVVRLDDEVLRTVELTVREDQIGLAVRFCEDFALHDWLLTTLGLVLEQAGRGRIGGRDSIDILSAAMERLLHLWMPGAHVDPAMRMLWDALEQRPGFSLQWNALVARIRDQIALQTLQALEHARRSNAEW